MPTTTPRVTVVIPNWNGLQHLPECLAALSAQSFRDFESIIVDNASTDGSAQWVRQHFPAVRVLQRRDNGGFSKAVNAGILASRSEYVALLNNDTSADPHWLGALVSALDGRHDYHFAASMMVLHSHPDRLNAAGDVYLLGRLAGRNRGFGEPASRYSRPQRVLGACAGAALYRRRMFDTVGLFDEDFFLMSEDTDLNLRCLVAGMRCLYVPGARVRHKYRASIDAAPAWAMTRLAIRNEAIVVAKDLPIQVLAFCPLLWPWRFIRQTLPLRPTKWHLAPSLLRQTPARLRAEVDGLRIGFAKRPDVWRRRRAGSLEIVRWLVRGVGEV